MTHYSGTVLHEGTLQECAECSPNTYLARVKAEHTARRPAKHNASAPRAEQHARYIDCSPAAWDDRDKRD
jgi:hypothetical protein